MASLGPAPFARVEGAGLYKDYGRQRALAGVSLTLRAGELTTLLGENGAGKSSLLSILAAITRPSRGSVTIDGRPLASYAAVELRRQLGVLSHEPRCYGDLSPRENLQLFGRLYDVATGAALAEQVASWLSTVGLTKAADRPARSLSRGMLQRLALARTLFHRPQLLLLDEPSTGLDQAGVALLADLLAAERQRQAIVVVVSHDLATVAPLGDQVIVLSRGKVALAQPSPADSPTRTAEGLRRLYEQAIATAASSRPSGNAAVQ